MTAPTTLMAAETRQIGQTLRRQLSGQAAVLAELAGRLRAGPPPLVVTCARGSSDHAASFGKYVIEPRLGVMVASHAPSTSSLFATRLRGLEGALFIAISQSGRSPDILDSIRLAKEAGAVTVALVNDESSPAASLADHVLPILAGPEQAVAATKSCAGAMLSLVSLTAALMPPGEARTALETALAAAPDVLDAAAEADWSAGVAALQSASSLFTLGRGLTFGVAMEAALKLKETCGLHAEGFSSAEVRHGPMALVGPDFPVLAFPPADLSAAGMAPLIEEFAARQGPVLVAGSSMPAGLALPVPPPLHPLIDPVVQLTCFYRLAEQLSLARGHNPDAPPYLAKVTRTA